MSETKLFGKAHGEFQRELLKLLSKWKLIKQTDYISEINIMSDADNSIISIIKSYENKEDIEF